MREAIRLCAGLLEHESLRPLVRELLAPSASDLESDEALDAWLYENIATTFHSCGTCKMGPDSDPMAVVDQYCRVRGLEGLRVVDLSVAPNVVARQHQRHRHHDRRAGCGVDRLTAAASLTKQL